MTKDREDAENDSAWPNEGEGSKTAAKSYDDAAERFARSGEVEEKAREAKNALDSGEASGLKQAEEEGKKHAAEEDPLLYEKG